LKVRAKAERMSHEIQLKTQRLKYQEDDHYSRASSQESEGKIVRSYFEKIKPRKKLNNKNYEQVKINSRPKTYKSLENCSKIL